MGRDQHDIDELARMERICLDLADGAVMPEERAELAIMAGNYRAAILHIKTGNAFADTMQTQRFFAEFCFCRKLLKLLGERAGARTQDPVIKSHVLYRLSYRLHAARFTSSVRFHNISSSATSPGFNAILRF